MLASLPCGFLIPISLPGGNSDTTLFSILLYVAIPILGWAPLIFHVVRNRHRPKTVTLIGAHIRGHLDEALGPHGPVLKQAASDLEQIVATMRIYAGDRGQKRAIVQASNKRMRRIFDLSFGPAALYGLSNAVAAKVIQEDAKWLDEVRQTCEKLTSPLPESESGDTLLSELREYASARDAAIDELRISG